MNINNRQEKLIDYLYDEMNKEDRAAFEMELQADASLQKELQQMKQVRSHLQSIPDVDLREPLVIPATTPPAATHRLRWLKPFYGVAASIAALLLLGAWTGLHVEAGKGELVLAFGKSVHTRLFQMKHPLRRKSRNTWISIYRPIRSRLNRWLTPPNQRCRTGSASNKILLNRWYPINTWFSPGQ